ncbi:MAG: SDR family NAD(P)-dependent oxidoreductase [Acidimicrobiales bacterium]
MEHWCAPAWERGAVEEIRRLAASDLVELVVSDLGDLQSVRRGATQILERSGRIDVLLNNAGLVLSSRTVTEHGFVTTFGVNHLGTST